MRKEPYGVDSIVHIVHRGTRGAAIVRDEDDMNRFLLMLVHFNDEHQPENWFRDIKDSELAWFERPAEWPEQRKLVHIIAFCLLNNHVHFLLKEIREGGISKFMQRLGTGMSSRFNQKYDEKGSLFQGSFRSRTVNSDVYLRYVLAYIQLKNVLDVYGGGISPEKDFERAYEWACSYPYASLGDHVGLFERPIVEKDSLLDIFSPVEFKEFCKDFLDGRAHITDDERLAMCFE